MPKISVITPLHEKGNKYIEEAMASLQSQTFDDFEWIVLVNNGGKAPSSVLQYDKADVYDYFDKPNIGALKAHACSLATGEIIVELDADDRLTPEALYVIWQSLQNEEKIFFYSESWEIKPDGTPLLYSPYFGWESDSEPIEPGDKETKYNKSFDVEPCSLRQIYWSPNHVRAWTKKAYDHIGGHDRNLEIGDDHDLIMRFYIAYGQKGFFHYRRPLYIYRVHPGNTFQEKIQKIADQSWDNYYRHIHDVLLRWCVDNDFYRTLLALDLGGRFDPVNKMMTVDKYQPCDIQLDADTLSPFGWHLIDTDSVGYIRAYDFIEHIKEPVQLMNEIYRILAPGGWVRIAVPSTDGRGAFQDPTHVSFWNLNSFWYYTNPQYAKYIQPGFNGKFQVARLQNVYPSDWHKENNIPYVMADLIALKGNWPIGESLWPR